MIDGYWSRFGDEITHLQHSQGDPALAALAAAIYIEDATGVTLPDDLLRDAALGTPDGARAVLERVVLERTAEGS